MKTCIDVKGIILKKKLCLEPHFLGGFRSFDSEGRRRVPLVMELDDTSRRGAIKEHSTVHFLVENPFKVEMQAALTLGGCER